MLKFQCLQFLFQIKMRLISAFHCFVLQLAGSSYLLEDGFYIFCSSAWNRAGCVKKWEELIQVGEVLNAAVWKMGQKVFYTFILVSTKPISFSYFKYMRVGSQPEMVYLIQSRTTWVWPAKS